MVSFMIIVLLINLAFASSSFDGSKRDNRLKRENQNMKASAFHYPPFFIINEDKHGNQTYSGFCYDIMNWISVVLDIRITYVPVNKSDIRKFGIIQSLLNQLTNKEVDIVPMTLIQTTERNRQMDFTNPILIGKSRMMLRYPEEESRLTAIFRPFSALTWVIICVIILSLTLTIVAVNYFQERFNISSSVTNVNPIRNLIVRSALFVVSLGVGQEMGTFIAQRIKKRLMIRFCVALWLLAAVVICNAYTGTITSFLALPKLKPIINNLKELAASDSYKLTAERNTVFTEHFLKATSGYYKTLGDSLRRNPHLLFSDYQQATKNVLTAQAVFVRGSIDILTRISQDMSEHPGECRLTASKEMGEVGILSLALAKNHPNKDIINKKLSVLWESGLLYHWFQEYIPNVDKCMVTSNTDAKLKKIPVRSFKLTDTSGIFLVLATGLAIALVTLLVELAVSFLNTYKTTMNVIIL